MQRRWPLTTSAPRSQNENKNICKCKNCTVLQHNDFAQQKWWRPCTDEDAAGLVQDASAAGRVVDAPHHGVARGLRGHVRRHEPSQPHLLR